MAATVGLLHLELHITEATSLKDKRRLLKSFKDRLANKHNVSVAEVDRLDSHQSAVLAIAMVGNDSRYLNGALQKIANAAADNRNMTLVDYDIQWL